MTTNTNWREQGACLNKDPELFFPIGATGLNSLQVHQAKQVCGTCTVRTACLDFALTTGIDHGVWGGLSEEERRTLRRRASRTRSRTR